jgi:hypothetical protein
VVDVCDPVPLNSVILVTVLVLFQYVGGTLLSFVLVLKLCQLFFVAIVIIHVMNHYKNILLIFFVCYNFNRVDFFITLLCNFARFLGHWSLRWGKKFVKVARL